MQISWMMRLVLETKSRLTWIDTEHKIILGWIRCAWLYIPHCILSLVLFVFFDFTDLKMLFHITYSLNIPGSSCPAPLTQMFWRFKYCHKLPGSPNETRTKCCHLFCYHILQHATHVWVPNDSPQVMFDVLAMTELLLYITNICDVNLVGESGDPCIKKELRIIFLWSFRHG